MNPVGRRALKTIQGLELTNANYDTVINLLQERYGKKQMVLDAHYTHLKRFSISN